MTLRTEDGKETPFEAGQIIDAERIGKLVRVEVETVAHKNKDYWGVWGYRVKKDPLTHELARTHKDTKLYRVPIHDEPVHRSSPMERISLPYSAPVYVTVNLATGDVERVYMDDESVSFDEGNTVLCLDDEPRMVAVDDPNAVKRALAIAEGVDWTSTDNRCVVWRGAYGGPSDIVEIFRAGVELLEALGELTVRNSKGHVGSRSDVLAALKFLNDSDIWESEQR